MDLLLQQRAKQLRPAITASLAQFSEHFSVLAEPGDYVLTPELNSLSFFIGNPQFGEIKDGAWVFFAEYQYLDVLLKNNAEQQ